MHVQTNADLKLCEREPIHIPGATQPHGAVIVALADSLLVTHASANLSDIQGAPAAAALGRPLREVLGEAAVGMLQSAGLQGAPASEGIHCLSGPNSGSVQMHAHRSGPYICVDIEPPHPLAAAAPPITLLRSVLETFKHATTQHALCELAVTGLKAITGYDRVMAYRFDADGHGDVIAEAAEPWLEPFLGIHYPAGDIPPQARRLFMRQHVCTTADFRRPPVPLLHDPVLSGGIPVDLTHSALRSVSPVHREYMANINAAASLTIALVVEEKLWGMLLCHHATPKIAAPGIRNAADMIGDVVSMLLRSLGQTESYATRLSRVAALNALVGRITNESPLPTALEAAEAELLHLVGADGALLRFSGKLLLMGRAPPLAAAQHALSVLWEKAQGEVLALSDVSLCLPELACCAGVGSGALLLPLAHGTDDAILWFRRELSRTVNWGGNPANHVSVDEVTGKLSPRTSFAIWQELVQGHSAPWTEAELAIAADLRGAVEVAIAQRTKAELARLRHYDALTGLPNRSLLEERLAGSQGKSDRGALLFVDLDRFKAVNDTMGHAAGDEMLVEVARRLVQAVGPENMAVRLGGDEFVVFCRGSDRDAATEIGERIRRVIEAPFEITGRECHISVSVGIAVADAVGGLDLVRAADMAMYAAKQAGANRSVVYEPSLFDKAARLFELEQDMRDALGRGGEFVLLYQPLFAISGGTKGLVGFEALVRWRHPRHGWMSPGTFIPLAEKSGLIRPLGDWVTATALRQGRIFQRENAGSPMHMAVNVSPLQLAQASFDADLAGALEAEGFAPSSLCLEVTESIQTDLAATAVLGKVRDLGVRVAIDDFGIGYSSLSYLRRLPVDMVKLDRSFLEDVVGDPVGVGFVGAVIALAHSVGKPVIFEGIETQEQFDIASSAGADMVQGFFFAPPLSANAAEELVVQHRLLGDRTTDPAAVVRGARSR